MQIVLDPSLKKMVEYDIWYSSDDGEWVCVASCLPFLAEISGLGETPEVALSECRVALDLAFKTFNEM